MTGLKENHWPKVLIIGIDGATFDLIKPWVEKGELPTFKRLLDEGIHSHLKSTIPPVTAPAWTSFITGKNPGKHGLYHFIEPQPGSYEIRYTNARSRLAKTVWQTLSESGISVGVINVPMTYPPEPVNGYMISGMDAPEGSTAITYPPDLYHELKKKFGKVGWQIRYLGNLKTDGGRDRILQSLVDMEEHYQQMTTYLIKRYPTDVMMVVFTSIDTVQHFFWHYMDQNHPQHDVAGITKYGDAILKAYKRMDQIIAQLTSDIPEETTIILMSDHGFGPTGGRVIRLNHYLADLGLLRLHNVSGWRLSKSLLANTIKGLDSILRSTLPSDYKARLARFFPKLRRQWESYYTEFYNINWKETKAYCYEVLTFPPSIWINLKYLRQYGIVEPGSEYEKLIQYITEKLYELRDPVTGKQLITRVYRKEEIYHGPYLDHAPDLIITWWDGIPLVAKPSFSGNKQESVVEFKGANPITSGEWGGIHKLHGILILKGAPFKRGGQLNTAGIVDPVPTLLYLLGLPIPDDLDGRVLNEAFTKEFTISHDVSTRKDNDNDHKGYVERTYSDEEAIKIEKQLRGLGYIE